MLVTHDLVGLFDRFTPSFVRQYAQLHSTMADAFTAYRQDVTGRSFPAEEHTFEMTEEEWAKFTASLE